jgi:hypothetical protein
MVTRRELLQTTGLVTASVAFGVAAPLPGGDPGWFDGPMRWAQLNSTEDDAAEMDIGFWMDYFKRIHADALCITAGGVVAFYPTKIKYHRPSRWLAQRPDYFQQVLNGCKKLGMVVVARTDPHATYDDVYQNHPDWIAVDAEGRKRRHWESPEMWVTCALGPYNFEFMTEVTKEIVSTFPQVGGIFSNRWEGSGMCYCEHCRRMFREYCAMDLPRTNNQHDPARRNYIVWREQRLFELWRLWDGEIRKINPAARYIANSGGATSGLDMRIVGELAPTLFADRQGRSGVMAPWANGKNGKEYRSTLGRKAIGGIFHMGVVAPHRWPDSVQNGNETRIWVLDGIANGMRPWFNKVGASIHDRRWLKVVEDLYVWHWRNQRYLRNEEPVARVGLVYSQQTSTWYGGPQARQKVEDYTLGMYHALVEARLPFEMVHDHGLDFSGDRAGRFKLLLLPNIAALSDGQCAQIRAFVEAGGSVLATYETSLYDENGTRRPDFGLADLFGVSWRKTLDGPIPNSYLMVEESGRGHAVMQGFEDAQLLINGTYQIEVQATARFGPPLLTAIPQYPSLPMEKNIRRVPNTATPGIFLREVGKGRVVYFPWDIDRVYWEVMVDDHGRLLRNAIDWALNEERPVTVTGPGVLDVTVWKQKDSMTVHLVNLTNPMMMRPSFREMIPVPAQQVRLRLPPGKRAAKVQFLVGGNTPPITPKVQRSRGWVIVTVPSIVDHEVIAVDLV